VSGLKCRACTVQFKQARIHELGLDKSKLTQYGIYLKDSPRRPGRVAVDNKPVRGELWEPLKNTIPMIRPGDLLLIVLGMFSGDRRWRRARRWTSPLFTSLAFTPCRRSGWAS